MVFFLMHTALPGRTLKEKETKTSVLCCPHKSNGFKNNLPLLAYKVLGIIMAF